MRPRPRTPTRKPVAGAATVVAGQVVCAHAHATCAQTMWSRWSVVGRGGCSGGQVWRWLGRVKDPRLCTPARTPGGQQLRLGGSCLFKTVGRAGLASDDAPPVVQHGEGGSSSWQWQGLAPPQRQHGGAEDSRLGQLMGTRGVGDDVVEMGRFARQQRHFLIWPPPW